MTRVWLRFAGFIWAAIALFGQQDAEPRIRTDVRQVLVPVVVADAKGHPAAGLTAADFRISEDGVRQTITSFSVETAAGSAESAARGDNLTVKAGAEPTRRTYVICFDTLHSSFANFSHVREAMEKLFQRDNGSGAQYVMVSLGRQLRIIQTATSDQKLLLSHLREKGFQDVLRGVDAQAMATEINDTRTRIEQFCRSCPCGPAARGNACFPERQALRQQLNVQAERTAVLTHNFLVGLRALIAELGNVPSSRALILISDGFSLTPGSEFFSVASAYMPSYSEFRFPPVEMEPELQATLSIAAKRDIRVYAVDSRGVSSPGFASGGASDAANSGMGASTARNRGGSMLTELDRRQNSDAFEASSGMSQLAAATGGIYFHASNDLLKELRSAIIDGREYYALSYTPSNVAQDGKYRKISVELRNPALTVRAKEGYWAEP